MIWVIQPQPHLEGPFIFLSGKKVHRNTRLDRQGWGGGGVEGRRGVHFMGNGRCMSLTGIDEYRTF